MRASSSSIRVHRILGFLAVLHAFLIASIRVALLLHGLSRGGLLPWVAFVTLWLFWPVILIVYPGRSLLRVAIPLLVSLPILWHPFREYRLTAPIAFGFPPGVRLSPGDIWDYFSARRAGHDQAESELRSGVLVVEVYGFPLPPEYADILRDRYHIKLKRIAGDTHVTAKVIGHAEGYNEVSKREIKRRFGDRVLEAAADKALKDAGEK
jgi:hypothetical protein